MPKDLSEKEAQLLLEVERHLLTVDGKGKSFKRELLYRLVHALKDWPDPEVRQT